MLLWLLFFITAASVQATTLIVPIEGTDEAWEIRTYGARVVNTWRSNSDMCRSRGATLLEIHDRRVNKKAASLVGPTQGIWLGLLYQGGGDYSWFSGSALSFTRWARGFPMSAEESRYYAFLKRDGTWATTDGGADLKPVCMKRIKHIRRMPEAEDTNEEPMTEDTNEEPMTEMIATERTVAGEKSMFKPKIYFDGMILHIDETPSTWLNAYYFCKRKGLGLPTVLTDNFNEILTNVVGGLRQPIWLALVGAGGRFWWMNGVPYEYNALAPSFQLYEKESTYTLLKGDGMWHDSCAGGSEQVGCEMGMALCVEIAPTATAEPGETSDTEPITTTAPNRAVTVPVTNKAYANKEQMLYGTPSGPCFDAVTKAKQRAKIGGNTVFYPFCDEDGYFRPLQCGKQTCWCVTAEGRLFSDSIDGSRERTTEECLWFRNGEVMEENKIEEPTDPAATELCVVAAKVYQAGDQFRQECQTCTCDGKNRITCTPTAECSQEEILCRYMDSFDFTCSKCTCNGNEYSSFSCLTYDRYCGREMTLEDNQIWYAYTQMVEGTTAVPEYDGNSGTDEASHVTALPATETIFEEGEKQYKVTVYMGEGKLAWIDAYYDCQSMGLTLPSDLNEVLNNYLSNFLRHTATEVWLNAEQSNGYAYWFTGAPMDYQNWAPYSDPEYNYGRAYTTLSYDGMWYAKSDYEEANYYCLRMEEVAAPKALKLSLTKDKCLLGEKEYHKGETFDRGCSRCTCYLYSTVYADCVRGAECRSVEPTQPPLETTREPPRVKSKCHGGARFLDCSAPCERRCGTTECRRHCTKECSCPPERPVFYGGCCVAESVCIDDGWF